MPDGNINSVKFEDRLFREIEDATQSHWQVEKTTQAKLEDQGLLAPVKIIVKKKPRKPWKEGHIRKIGTENLWRSRTVQARGPHRKATDL